MGVALDEIDKSKLLDIQENCRLTVNGFKMKVEM